MSQVTWNFKGKRVLVTGGAAGIGLAIGTEFLRAGAQVAFLDRDKTALEKAVETASTAGPGEALSVVCDLTITQEIIRAAQDTTERLGSVDILVNNAGVGGSRSLVELSDEELDLNLDVNLRATILLTRELLRGMLERSEGVVINISSQAGKRGFPDISHYSASKAGVLGFTRSLAAEVAPKVRVNAICPGMVLTGMMQNNIRQTSERKEISLYEARAEWSSGIPMGRMQQPVDIANAALFLASDAAREITGEALNVSGGQTTH
jgi:meso-butanediol dehydrogenase/(S,S)-butanediol dehydrogenase/diacetyl reductase